MYDHAGHQILHEEETNMRGNNYPEYNPKEDKLLIYCPFYVKNLEGFTKTSNSQIRFGIHI